MKKRMLSAFLSLCLVLTMVPAAFAGQTGANNVDVQPADAKIKIVYSTGTEPQQVTTVYFNNDGNDDWGTSYADGDHAWDPLTYMDGVVASEKAVVTLLDDITLTDTTMLVLAGKEVTINGEGQKITCTLTGNIPTEANGAHKAGNDAISIPATAKLTLDNVTLEISKGEDGTNATQGIYNDGTLTLQNGAKITVNGVSQNGINGSTGTLVLDGANTQINVQNVGGSGIKCPEVTVNGGATVAVTGAQDHGVSVTNLTVSGTSSVKTENTGRYGITAAQDITLSDTATIQATEAAVPIRVQNGTMTVPSGCTVTGDVVLGEGAQVDGDGKESVSTSQTIATVNGQAYVNLDKALADLAANGGSMTLLQNANMTQKVTFAKNATIDGSNGNYTITGAAADANVYFEITGGTFEISNVNLTGFGDEADSVVGAGVFKLPNTASSSAKIVANNITVEKFNRAAFDIRNGVFELTDCSINCDNGQTERLTKGIVAGYDNAGTVMGSVNGCTITGSDSTYEGWSASGIEVSSGATVTVTDTQITSMKGGISVARNYGHGAAVVTVSGDTTAITANDYALRVFESNNSSDPIEGTSATLNVNGGKYTGDVRISTGDGKTPDGASKIVITGGTFSADPSAFVSGDYTIQENNGEYTVVAKAAKTITFDANGGTFENGVKTKELTTDLDGNLTVAQVETLGEPTYEGYTFEGWELDQYTDASTPSVYVFEQDTTVKAVWEKEAEEPGEDNSYTITFDANGGTFSSTATTSSEYFTAQTDTQGYLTKDAVPQPTRSNYTFGGWSSTETGASEIAHNNLSVYQFSADTTLYAVWNSNGGSSGGSGGSSGGGGGSSSSETTTNPDGSTTTIVTKPDGSTIETTKNPDGSSEVVETAKDGTVTTTTTDADGNKTEVVQNTDGSSETTVTNKDGSSSTTTVASNGQVTAEVNVPSAVVSSAENKGEAVALPMPSVSASSSTQYAPSVTVNLPSGKDVKVEIPVENVNAGTVAVLVKADGTEEVIKTTVETENGIAVTLSDGDTVKVVNNASSFSDVSSNYWGADAVAFATSRELFNGTSATTFAPETTMNRAMIVTVLARLEGVDTTGGANWYDAGRAWAMEKGISDGSNMSGNLSREQLATMLYRYAGEPAVSGGMDGYTDAASVSDYAQKAMAWAISEGIITGYTANTLNPQGEATRAQVATMLMRFCNSIA